MNCQFGLSICSGRVTAIVLDPFDPSTIYLGAAQGGVWKTTDRGSTWVPLLDNPVDPSGTPLTDHSIAVGSIAIDPNGVIYVGTGEANLSGDSYYGAGVLKSSDGGSTWTLLGASDFGRSAISRIVVNPTDTNVVLAATTTGATASSTCACSTVAPGAPLGVYRSDDAGATWSNTLAATAFATDITLDPSDPTIVYAAVDGGIFKSTDGGSSWTGPLGGGLPAPSGVGRIALGTSASNPLTVLAAMETFTVGGQLWRTTDGGSSWSQVPTPPSVFNASFCSFQCFYDIFIDVDPSNSNILYLGGLDLYRTTNAGNPSPTWTDLGGYTGNIHPDQHAFAFDTSSSTATSTPVIYVGNDGGIWSSTSGDTCSPSSCWTNLNSGLSITQFQSLATHPTDSDTYFGGTQDNGTPEHTGTSVVWSQLIGGDGGWTAFDPSNPSTMYHTFFGVSPQRSDDGGLTWQFILNGLLHPCSFDPTKLCTDSSLFYIPMAIDPTSPDTLYLGTFRLYKTTDRGTNWLKPGDPGLSPGLDLTTGPTGTGSSWACSPFCGIISAVTVAPSDGGFVYAGTNRGRFFVSTDGGLNFAEADTGLPGGFITKIAVDPTDPSRVFMTFSGFVGGPGGHVFMTTDSGASWVDVSSNLPDFPTTAIALDPTGTVVIVGTDIGVFLSSNTDQNAPSWDILGSGLPRVAVYELVFAADGTLLAATHGRGVWAFEDTSTDITPPSTITLSAANPQILHPAISDFTDLAISRLLAPGQTNPSSVKLGHGLTGTGQSATSYPGNTAYTESLASWTKASFNGTEPSSNGSAFFRVDDKVVS